MINKILNRVSIRSYTGEKLPKDIYENLIKVINSSPTSMNGSSFSAIVIDDENIIKKIIDLTGFKRRQEFLLEASMFVIFCADLNRLNYSSVKNNVDVYNNNLDLLITAAGDAFISATMLMNAAISYDLGTCFVGTVRMAHEYLKQELNLIGQIIPMIGLVIGYPNEINDVKPKQDKIFFNKYSIDQLKNSVDEYDYKYSKYVETRNSNNKLTNWSEPYAQTFSNKEILDIIDENYKTWKW